MAKNHTEYDDKSDTVMTGFNTEELNEHYEKFFSGEELFPPKERSKSVGNEAKAPFIQGTPTNSEGLDQIEELEDSQEWNEGEENYNERKDESPLVRLPAAKRLKNKSNPFGLNVK